MPPLSFSRPISARETRRLVAALLLAVLLPAGSPVAKARNLIGGPSTAGTAGPSGTPSTTATSQTATAATTAAAQAAQAAVVARRAQDSLIQSTAAFQSLQAAQAAARQAALVDPSNNLGSPGSPLNGLGAGALDPAGGVTSTTGAGIQIVALGSSGKNEISLSNGGTVALPKGMTGTDQVTLSGAGSVTTTGGTITTTSGSLTTSTGATLAASNGGSISFTAGSGTLTSSTATTITSTQAGTVTLPSGGGTIAVPANQAITIPAGSSVAFSGTGTATVTVSGAGTVALSGAGTLSLGTGGSITTSSGSTSFTNGAVSSLAAGSTIDFSGSGTLDFTGSGDKLPVIVEPNVVASTSNPAAPVLSLPAFSTTGTILNTTGYALPASWTGIEALSQSQGSGSSPTVVTITQDQQQALLNWTSFNVGKNTILDFDQSAGGVNVGDWIAINRILDPSLAPSQILGAIQSSGQVYVINQNGIIFGGSSQIDTHALVASTLPINSNLISAGLLNNPDGQFLFTSIAVPSLQGSTPYDPTTDPDVLQGANGVSPSGNIQVKEGASITSPGSALGVGGKIALIAPNVDNEGTLSAPDGQVILAAGQQVGLEAHPGTDPSLRGLDVAVGAGEATDSATNGLDGFIYAPEAEVTMAGLNINQLGEIDSVTSVSLNGRIDFLAENNLSPVFLTSDNAYIFGAIAGLTNVGTVDLGAHSLTEILPDYSSTDTQVGTTLALPSQFYAEGGVFHMEGGAQLLAPNATATLGFGILDTSIAAAAGQTTNPLPENTGVTSSGNGEQAIVPVSLPPPASGQYEVVLDQGANLDVSGSSDVQASVAENIVSAELTQAVLENSSLQESGPLRGQTVQVDVSLTGTNADGSTWYGSPIGDLSGYANLVERTVGELTVAGGSVAINTSGSVQLASSSTINVSGGSIDYQGAMVQTTKVITADGHVLDISQATPDQVYQGVDNGFNVTSAKWGTTQTYGNALSSGSYYDNGYVSGGNGGSLSINTQAGNLNGSLYGNIIQGVRQQAAPPISSTFNLDVQGAVNVVVQPVSDSQADPGAIYLSPDLFGTDGFSNATISTESAAIDVSSDTVISTAAGGSLNLTAANIAINGQIYVPSGKVTLTALAQDPIDFSNGTPTPYDPTIGNLDISSTAVIATTGLAFDEMANVTPGTLPFKVNGGTIALTGAVTTLEAGSLVDASGGAARNVAGKILDGQGGSISLTGSYNGAEGLADGQLVLDGTLSAFGIGKGGSLTLKAPAVQVGGSLQSFPGDATVLTLSSTFFSQGGFSNFSVSGSAGVDILTGIAPVLTEEEAEVFNSQLGIDLISSSQLPQFPAAPVNLAFSAPGSKGIFLGTVDLAAGADIVAGATSSVSLTGQLVNVLGEIIDPGGSISISGSSTTGVGGAQGDPPDVTVYLGAGSLLDTDGALLSTSTAGEYQTYTTGEALNGGSITIKGNIVGDEGASLSANGAAGALDVPLGDTATALQSSPLQSMSQYVHEVVASNGGSISLNGTEELYYGGTVSATPGNQTAIGGTLTVSSGLVATQAIPPDAGYPELFISQDGTFPTGTVTLGSPLPQGSQTGGGYFTVDQFTAGGFGSLILDGNVEFKSSVTINASQEVQIVPDSLNGTVFADPSISPTIEISAPYIAIGATTLDVSQQSVSDFAPDYIQVGSSSDVLLPASPIPGLVTPTYGAATLSLNATDLIDVGFLSLQNIGTTNFSVASGDIRGGGLFYAAGTINLTAGQIYTPTAATFTVAAFDAGLQQGTINIFAGVSRSLPLSAGGTINIYATNINQDGVLEAPFGTINLGALPDPTTGLTPVLPGVQVELNTSTGAYEYDPVYTQYAPETQQLTLGKDSITSVSGVSSTGQVLDLPYGTILNGTEWIAPNGADITAGGLPGKAVHLEGTSVNDVAGSLVDLAGGGDLFAYQFSPGVGGTNDILNIDRYVNGAVVTTSADVPVASTSFAIVPDYGLNYAPVDLTVDSNADFPYADSNLTSKIGDQIYLAGGDGLAAGTYTVLPARYALLPDAYLVTPSAEATSAQTSVNPDGSLEMRGYFYNTLDSTQQIVPSVTGFEVDSAAVINDRAEYDIASANTFLSASALANSQPVPRLPVDAGQLVFSATNSLNIQGSLAGQVGAGGLGSTVDIGSPDDIYIVSNNNDTPTLQIPAGVDPADYAYLTLSASELDSFGADSLLIGGLRASSASSTTIDPTTNAIYVENDAQSPLVGNEIILVSKQTLTLADNSDIEQSGVVSTGEQNFTVGTSTVAGSGDGTLIRVTGDPNAQFNRVGVNTADTAPDLVIGAGASIGGVAVTLDSSSGAVIDPSAAIDEGIAGQALILRSGTISLQIDPQVSLASAPGLTIGNATLQTLESSVQKLSLSSYSTINLYGAGTLGGFDAKGQFLVQDLALEGAGIFGYDADGGTVTINAQNVTIDNTGNQTLPGSASSLPSGNAASSLVINAGTINLGANTFTTDGYSSTSLVANDEIVSSGTGGLSSQGQLNLATPLITASTGANFAFDAQGGSLTVSQPTMPGTAIVTGGLGATISLTGTSVDVASTISLPSGTINVQATTGNVEVQSGGELSAVGKGIVFGGVTAYTSGGAINLASAEGNVLVDQGSQVNVSAPSAGGDAGTLSLSAVNGTLSVANGTLEGTAGSGGTGGSFNAHLGQASTLSSLTNPAEAGGFQSLAFDVLNGSVTVDGPVGPALGSTGLTSFSLTADQGGITVDGAINASGVTGGSIDLYANEGVTLTGNAYLTVAAQQPNDADEGGTIDIETRGAGPAGGNAINIESGATLDLAVANPNGNSLVQDGSSTVGGVLHLRAPTTNGNSSLAVDPIDGTITGASSVIAEGYNVYTPAGGVITAALEGSSSTSVANDGTVYGDAEGFAANTAAILSELINGTPNAGDASLFQVTPGAEIINASDSVNGGNLTLAANWDLSSFRFGPGNVAGDLTLRAANNIVFTGSLTDGFAYNSADTENVAASPYTWDVKAGPSWSYRLVAGAAFTSSEASTANYGSVQTLGELGLDTSALTDASLEAGSLLLGQNMPYNLNDGTKTATVASKYAQLIRTGTGTITIDTGGSVDLLNQLATIYTAGTVAPTLTGFSSPTGTSDTAYEKSVYGTTIAPAPQYTAQYTENGGDVSIDAQQDIAHLTVNSSGNLVTNTSWQFPTNWLYRRGATSSTDVFDTNKANANQVATTTWWVDFSNFFEGIGALGGGNVAVKTGGNIVNVDVVVPTNARMPYAVADVASSLVELGGGDLSVFAGGTIEGGTYYVERGTGTIDADNIISAGDTARISAADLQLGYSTPLPLTLFVGDSSITVNATNDLTVGSTVNPFLLPQGIGNNFTNESVFSTYGADSSVDLSSLLGTINIQGSEANGSPLPGSLYDAYLSNASPGGIKTTFTTESSLNGTPWTLTLDPTSAHTGFVDNVTEYSTFYALSPPVFSASAFSGDIQYESDQLLAPSAQGTLRLLAAGSIDGAYSSSLSGQSALGLTATITILDDDPSKLPSVVNPFGLGASTPDNLNNPSIDPYILQVFGLMGETTSYANESLPTLESYHTSGLLHNNPATPPVEIDTISGDIGDLTLISPEKVAISSGLDLQDVSFYIQNNNADDISVVSADRDITLFDPNSAGLLNLDAANSDFVAFGDVQISGPGTLEVLAGRNLNLGEGTAPGTASAMGTGVGITSIGNSRDPYLGFDGANIIAAAGLGDSSGLSGSQLDFGNVTLSNGTVTAIDTAGYAASFIGQFLDPSTAESDRYLPDLGALMNLSSSASDQQIWAAFAGESKEQQDALATSIFYDVLRDAGRDHNDPASPNVGTYAEGYAAIAALFPSSNSYQGDISLTSREIKTTNDGDIDLLAPGGGIDVGLNNLGAQAIDQGILTVDGGNISIFTKQDVSIGTSRIFTLHGGNIIIWSSAGNIDAGASSRTVQSAPPTRVLVDSQSANVETDLAGLATGGGIGVLETVVGAPPGDVDLIAPVGTVDAGDAGIRSSGNINIAAAQVLNAGNIQAGGSTSGVPTSSAPNISGTVAASTTAGAADNAASEMARQQQQQSTDQQDVPSIISVEVISYGDEGDNADATPVSKDSSVAESR